MLLSPARADTISRSGNAVNGELSTGATRVAFQGDFGYIRGTMRIIVGTTNEVKIGAVRQLAPDYPCIAAAEITGIDVPSGVSEQPKSLKETMTGAMHRAGGAWGLGKLSAANGDLSFGIESGLFQVPFARTGHMDVCVCAIFDGKEFEFGLSSAWESPADVTRYMIEEGLDMNQAYQKAGYTDDPKIGSSLGAIGLVTRGRLSRMKYTMESVRTALIGVEAKRK